MVLYYTAVPSCKFMANFGHSPYPSTFCNTAGVIVFFSGQLLTPYLDILDMSRNGCFGAEAFWGTRIHWDRSVWVFIMQFGLGLTEFLFSIEYELAVRRFGMT